MFEHQLPTPTDTPTRMDFDEPSPTSYAHNSTTWTPVDSMTPISTNPSRKRSRDESAFDLVDGGYFHAAEIVKPPEPIPEEPIYGEGMVLINPSTGAALGAESQTGTWYEEKADHETLKREVEAANFRPKLPTSRKSIRLSQSSIKTGFESFSAQNNDVLSSTITVPASPPKTSSSGSHPEIDDATLALGIGWTKISSDENIQTAARGWARYLENHYARHVHGAEILLQSTGLNAYLVGCQEGFYLFAENLLEGRLVSRSWDGCLANLRAPGGIVFEGEHTLSAERTPGPDLAVFAGQQQQSLEQEPMAAMAVETEVAEPKASSQQISSRTPQNWAEYNRLQNPNGAWVAGMEMD
ncbi:uncharacterized protein AB675_2042 [Cyphellophora attinorum]|uniref:Uncharacterized protein n=1 Tax=Cyphellophora attinorum TaxID=1664694 RepID=A0A0N0NPI5_9EURO|nr:uncharacterized protein AB675_2042 [Phialophora attinorum]KPI42791.1 hypothetical protein AB675_2042 [Phialophora attinorum]